jgi:pimeloyl-ACP methyl ester carboxylesterase
MSQLSTVTSAGVRLAVREHSPPGPGRPTVVLVHGYPDQQDMWDLVVAALPLDRLHVVTYDVRGAGASDAPSSVRDYRTELLVEDLAAVLDAVLPADGRAHLVGHDWGSVQLWEAVAVAPDHPRLADRIASFTSISGPALSHSGWLSRHPSRRRLRLLRQLLRSWYVFAFLVPGPADLAWRAGHRVLGRVLAAKEGLGRGHWGEELGRNAVHGLNLYRANVLRRTRRLGTWPTRVPVQVVRPTRDAYLTDVLLDDLDRFCEDVRVVEVDAGHWVTRTDPEGVAALVVEHVGRCEAGATT